MRNGVIAIVTILIMMAGIGFVSGSELIFEDDFESCIVGSYPSSPWYSIWLGHMAYMPDLYTVNTIPVYEVVSDPTSSMNEVDTANVSHPYDSPAQVDSVEVGAVAEVLGTYPEYESGMPTIVLEGHGNSLSGVVNGEPKEEWNMTYGGTGGDWANDVQQTSDGGYILVVGTHPYGSEWPDAWLIKTDSKGKEMWSETFGGTGGTQLTTFNRHQMVAIYSPGILVDKLGS